MSNSECIASLPTRAEVHTSACLSCGFYPHSKKLAHYCPQFPTFASCNTPATSATQMTPRACARQAPAIPASSRPPVTVKIMNRRVASISVLLAFWCCSAPDIAEPITLNTICATQIPGLLAKCVESEQVKKWIEDHHMVHCELWSNIYDTLFVYLNEIARAPSFSGWRKLTMYP